MHDNRLSLAASPLEQDMVYQVADYMPGCNMNLLNPWSNIGIHIEQYIHHLGHFTAALACQTDGFNTHIPRHLYCRNDIFWLSTGGYGQQDIPLPANGLYLF